MNCDCLFEREALPKLSGGFGTVAFVRTGDAHRSKCSGVPSKVQFKTNTDEGEGAEAISKADRNVSISLRGEFGPLISPANSRSTPSPTGDVTNAFCLDGN